MALIPVLTADARVLELVNRARPGRFAFARSSSWDRLLWLVRERPATAVVVDGVGLPEGPDPDQGIADLRRRFPSLGCVLVSRRGMDRSILLRLGHAAIRDLELIQLEDLISGLPRAIARASSGAAIATVLRRFGGRLPAKEREVMRAALEGALLGWGAPELAHVAGCTPQHLSVRLRARGLPSTGKLLLWARLLHASNWVGEPGRSAESVSRQLGYANGAVFRRVLRSYLDMTPTELREAGGLSFTLKRFLDECGLGDSLSPTLSVA